MKAVVVRDLHHIRCATIDTLRTKSLSLSRCPSCRRGLEGVIVVGDLLFADFLDLLGCA